MNNNALGRRFEIELCNELFEHGFWVHRLNANNAGQPADIIAVRNRTPHLIDCKYCQNGVFRLDRIEANQETAMTLWEESGNGPGWFALKHEDQVFMFPLIVLLAERNYGLSHVEIKDLMERKQGLTLDKWIKKCK